MLVIIVVNMNENEVGEHIRLTLKKLVGKGYDLKWGLDLVWGSGLVWGLDLNLGVKLVWGVVFS